MVEEHKTVVYLVIAILWTAIADQYAWEELVGLAVADWHDVCMHSVAFVIDVQLCPDD
jgi:hypothetical protein